MVVIQSCGGISSNRGCGVATMFNIVVGVVSVIIISFTGEVGVIITASERIIMRERLTIAVGKDNPTGIAACKGMDTINDLISHGEVGPFAADNFLD